MQREPGRGGGRRGREGEEWQEGSCGRRGGLLGEAACGAAAWVGAGEACSPPALARGS